MIINIIPTIKGGGAEIIVRELHNIYLSKNLDAFTIYFTGDSKSLKKNEILLDLNYKNPLIILYLRKVIKKILRKANSNKRVIIHAHLTWAFFFTILAVVGLKNIKLFYTEHDTSNRRRKLFFFKIIDSFFYDFYSSVICISRGVYQSLVKWVGHDIKKRLVIIPNGSRIFNPIIRAPLTNRLPRLISIGTLNSKKNFSTSIAVIAKLRDTIENYTIIGEGPERKKLEKIIKNLKLEKKVTLIGWSDNIKQHLYKSDIQLIPSLFEGFGLVAAEGMSTGLPIVASNVDGLLEVLGRSNPSVTLINKVESIEEWEKGINKAIKNIKILGNKKISRLSSQQAKKFTFKKMAKNYLKIYNKFN
jgi:glycosyltransferase involved in cell wall biosynthesis